MPPDNCPHCGRKYHGEYCGWPDNNPVSQSGASQQGDVAIIDWLEPLAEDFARNLRLRIRMETSLERKTVEALVKYATETFVDTLRSGSNGGAMPRGTATED